MPTPDSPTYLQLDRLIEQIDEPNKRFARAAYDLYRTEFETAAGSKSKHQAWIGGYIDHVTETMNIARLLYQAFSSTGRLLGFTLSDALLVLFLHDLEKAFAYSGPDGVQITQDKHHRKVFRAQKIQELRFDLTDEHQNALLYVEGEGDDYDPHERVMGDLAAFCHLCDTWSARGWHQFPLPFNDPWKGAQQSQYAGNIHCTHCGWIGQRATLKTQSERSGGQHWISESYIQCPSCTHVLERWESDSYLNYPG